MKKIPMKAIGNSIKVYMTKHSPEILTGIGIGGFLTTIGMTIKIAPRAKAEIEDAEYYADKYNEPIRYARSGEDLCKELLARSGLDGAQYGLHRDGQSSTA